MRIHAQGDVVLNFEKDYPWGPDDPAVAGLRVLASSSFAQVDVQVVLFRGEGPSPFLRWLYEDFRGWDGERAWRPTEGRPADLRGAHRMGATDLDLVTSCAG